MNKKSIILAFFLIGIIILSISCERPARTYVPEPTATPVPVYTSTPTAKSISRGHTEKHYKWITFKATAYCPCVICCGKSDGITKSGVKAVEGITIASDASILPLKTIVYIEGVGTRIVQDTGVYGQHIDLYFDSHQDALNFGEKTLKIRIIER